MIGELINKFDEQQDNSIAAFNRLFHTELQGKGEVVIGEMLVGGLREVFINGVPRRMVLTNPNLIAEKGRYAQTISRRNPYIYVASKGDKVLKFNSLTEISRALRKELSHIHRSIDVEQIDGWSITKIDRTGEEIDATDHIKELAKSQGYQGRSGKHYYIVSKDGIEERYNNLSKLSRTVGMARTSLQTRFKTRETTEVNGYTITRKEK